MPISAEVPPMDVAQIKFPAASSFCVKISKLPADIRLAVPDPGSKSAVSWKYPATYAFPKASEVMDCARSNELPPMLTAQIKLPAESSFSAKISLLPAEVRFKVPVPGSKSAVP